VPPASTTTGTKPRPEPSNTCEDELAKVKAALAECQAAAAG
jgi:hypothetical protein